jgi:uncharacterized membrane protein
MSEEVHTVTIFFNRRSSGQAAPALMFVVFQKQPAPAQLLPTTEERNMPEKYIFIVIKYPQAGTAFNAITAIMDLMRDQIISLKDALAVTKTETGEITLCQAQNAPAGPGFLNGRLIGIIFAELFGSAAWDMNGALAGTATSLLGQGIQDLLLEEFGEKMTPEESAVTALLEHADWRKALDHMRPLNFQGEMVISQNVTGDLVQAEQLLDNQKIVFVATEEAETPPNEGKDVVAVPETLAVPAPKGLKYIEGIGDVYRVKLFEAGIRSVDELLEEGSTSKGRKEIAEQTGISETLLLRWINHADLYRIHGIGPQYAELLEVAGVDTVPELAQRVPANLLEKMTAANAQRKLVRHLPALVQVESWVTQAKELPRKINY